MKTFIKLSLIAVTLGVTAAPVRGFIRNTGTYAAPGCRSNVGAGADDARSGYYYRNPYAAYPSVNVRQYTRDNGTVVLPHQRTPANETQKDNLSYRGYGTIQVPSAKTQDNWLQAPTSLAR